MMRRQRQPRRTGRLIWPILTIFAVRAIVPIGYMPASLADGGPFTLCHGSSAATLALIEAHIARQHVGMSHAAPTAGAEHGHPMHDGERTHDKHWDHCPLGIGSADAALSHATEFALGETESIALPELSLSRAFVGRVRPYRSRAPPA